MVLDLICEADLYAVALHEDVVHDLLRESLVIFEALLTHLSDWGMDHEASERLVITEVVHESIVFAVEFHLVSVDVNLAISPYLLIRLTYD